MAESSLPYGPFTSAVRRFLRELALVPADKERLIVDRYLVIRAEPSYQAAERVLGAAIARSGRERERDALGGPLLQMMRQPLNTGELVAPGAPEDAYLRPLAEPALAALLALMMQDVLSPEHVARLYDPFESVISRATLS